MAKKLHTFTLSSFQRCATLVLRIMKEAQGKHVLLKENS